MCDLWYSITAHNGFDDMSSIFFLTEYIVKVHSPKEGRGIQCRS